MDQPSELVRSIRDQAMEDSKTLALMEVTIGLANLPALHETTLALMTDLQRVVSTASGLLRLYEQENA